MLIRLKFFYLFSFKVFLPFYFTLLPFVQDSSPFCRCFRTFSVTPSVPFCSSQVLFVTVFVSHLFILTKVSLLTHKSYRTHILPLFSTLTSQLISTYNPETKSFSSLNLNMVPFVPGYLRDKPSLY